MDNKIYEIRVQFPEGNELTFLTGIVMCYLAFNNYFSFGSFIGIPNTIIFLLMTFVLGMISLLGVVQWKKGKSIELYKTKLKIDDFEIKYKDLEIEWVSKTDALTFSDGIEKIIVIGKNKSGDLKLLDELQTNKKLSLNI